MKTPFCERASEQGRRTSAAGQPLTSEENILWDLKVSVCNECGSVGELNRIFDIPQKQFVCGECGHKQKSVKSEIVSCRLIYFPPE